MAVNLFILGLPLVAFVTARLAESELLRRAEAELIAQGSTLAAACALALPEGIDLAQISGPLAEGSPPSSPDPSMGVEVAWIDVNRIAVLDAPSRREIPKGLEATGDGPDPWEEASTALAARIGPLVRRSAAATGARVVVADHRGRVITATEGGGGSVAHLEEIERALSGQPARALRRCEGGASPLEGASGCWTRLSVALPIVERGRVVGVVALDKAPVSWWVALSHNTKVAMIFVGVLIAAVLAQTLFISRAIVSPVNELTLQAERLAAGERQRVDVIEDPVTMEVERLSRAVARMASTLDLRARTIQTFAAHVSHEFKTPLSSIRGAVELLEDHLDDMDPAERARFLARIDRHAERLERLVVGLLELARADTLQPADQRTSPHAAIADLRQRYGESLTVDLDGLPAEVRCPIAPAALEAILGNLVDNAHQHGGPEVRVALRARVVSSGRAATTSPSSAPAGDKGIPAEVVCIEVEDSGGGVPEADRGNIFTPFFTTARDQGGTGLGLAIASAMLDAHEGSIALLPGSPTIFRVTLPLSLPDLEGRDPG